MHVFDQDDRGSFVGQLGEERCPRVVQALPGDKRVQLLIGFQAQGEPEVAAPTQPAGRDLRRVGVQDAEVLAQQLGQRPVGRGVPVREAAAGALQRLRLLFCQP